MARNADRPGEAPAQPSERGAQPLQGASEGEGNPCGDRKPSPQAKLKAANIELQEELHRLRQHGDGNAFTKNDSAKAIAAVVIHTFDGLSNKTAKVEAIVRELNAWVKQQKMAAQ